MIAKTVVVVEDDPTVRRALKTSLEFLGYDVVSGSSVEIVAAMLTLKQSTSSLRLCAIVADFRLDRGISGVTVVRCLRKIWGNAFPSVIMTGDRSPHIVSQAAAQGIALLYKPFQLPELLALIDPERANQGADRDTLPDGTLPSAGALSPAVRRLELCGGV